MEKRIAGTKAKAVGAVLRHGHNSQRARARKAANEAGQSNLLKIIVLDLGIDFHISEILLISGTLLLIAFGEMTIVNLIRCSRQ